MWNRRDLHLIYNYNFFLSNSHRCTTRTKTIKHDHWIQKCVFGLNYWWIYDEHSNHFLAAWTKSFFCVSQTNEILCESSGSPALSCCQRNVTGTLGDTAGVFNKAHSWIIPIFYIYLGYCMKSSKATQVEQSGEHRQWTHLILRSLDPVLWPLRIENTCHLSY